MKQLVEFLRDNNSRVSYGDKWLCVSGVGDDIIYTVYQRKYGARKTTELYMGAYLSTALLYLGDDLS